MAAPLVLLHGYPFEASLWEKVVPHLTGVTPVALNLPGFGREPVLQQDPSLDAMAEHVSNALTAKGIEKAAFAGFSMGGYVTLAIAERFPNRIVRLALVNSQPFADSDEVRAGRRAIIEKVKQEGAEVAVKAALQKLFAPGKASDPNLRQYAERGGQLAGAKGITWALEAMARRPDRTAVLQKLSVPILIVHSPLDQFIAVERVRNFAKTLPNATYVEIPDAGHCTPLETPERVAKALNDFVAS